MADTREQGAEMTFCVGGKLAQFHRNDTYAADGPAHTTAMQLVHIAAAVVAAMTVPSGKFQATNIRQINCRR